MPLVVVFFSVEILDLQVIDVQQHKIQQLQNALKAWNFEKSTCFLVLESFLEVF